MQARHFHLLFVFIFIVSFAQRAGAVEDGVYEIQYELLHASNDSVSIANDYFEKPAIWIVEGDEQYVQLTLNHSEWTKQLQAPVGGEYVDVTVIEEDRENDLRTIQFPLEQSIGEPVEMKMHVLIETMTPVYDHRYTVRLQFDEQSAKRVEQQEAYAVSAETKSEQPLWRTPLLVTGSLLVAGALFVGIAFARKNKKNKGGITR